MARPLRSQLRRIADHRGLEWIGRRADGGFDSFDMCQASKMMVLAEFLSNSYPTKV